MNIMNYWELAAWCGWTAAVVCLGLAGRYRALYLIGRQEITIYNQLITRIDTAFGHMRLSLVWQQEGNKWEVRDGELKKPGFGTPYLERLAADPNWTVALQNAVHLVESRRRAAPPAAPDPEPAR